MHYPAQMLIPRKIIVPCIALMLSFTQSSAAEKQANTNLTLEQAVETALRQNPQMQKAREEIYRAQGRITSSRGPALPRLSVSANLTFDDQYLANSRFNPNRQPATITLPIGPGGSNVTIPFGDGSRQRGRVIPTNEQWDVSITLSKTLFDGFGTRSQIAAAKLERDVALFGLQETALQVIQDTQLAYYRALLTRDLIAVERESLQLLQEELANQKRRFEAGTVPRFNVLRSEVELANARPSLIRAENAHRIALQNLAVILGMDDPSLTSLAPPITLVDNLDADTPRILLENALRSAREKRPLVRQLEALNEIRRQGIRLAASRLYPRLTAFVSYSILKEQFTNDWSKTDSGYRAGLSGTWDLFDGLAVYGDLDQARAAENISLIETADRLRLLDLEVREAYSRYVEALELVSATAKTVEQAREALRLANTRFDAGAATQLDVLNSRVALTQALTLQLQARHDLQAAVARLNRASALGFKFTINTTQPENTSPTAEKSATNKLQQQSTYQKSPQNSPPVSGNRVKK